MAPKHEVSSDLLWPKIFLKTRARQVTDIKRSSVVLKGSIAVEEWASRSTSFVGEMIHNHAWLRILKCLEWGSTTKGEETITGGVCCFEHTLCQTFPGYTTRASDMVSGADEAIVVVIVVHNCNACGGLILEKRICKQISIRHKDNQKRGYVLG